MQVSTALVSAEHVLEYAVIIVAGGVGGVLLWNAVMRK
jgi:hypothetical protein